MLENSFLSARFSITFRKTNEYSSCAALPSLNYSAFRKQNSGEASQSNLLISQNQNISHFLGLFKCPAGSSSLSVLVPAPQALDDVTLFLTICPDCQSVQLSDLFQESKLLKQRTGKWSQTSHLHGLSATDLHFFNMYY